MTSFNKTDERGEKLIVAPANKLKARRGPAFQESRSRIQGHNFAIRLLQTLEARIHLIVEDFCVGEGSRKQHSTLDRQQFVVKMMSHIRAGPSNPDEVSWLASIPVPEMEKKVGEVFDSADSLERGRISFATLMSYVIDCASYGEVGSVQEAIPEYTGSQGTMFRNLEEINKARYCPELERVITSGKQLGLIATQTFHTQALVPYPHMMGAADRFATCYAVDYVPHMECLAFVGTDRFLDFMHVSSGEVLLKIPVTQTYTACSFDRSTKLLLASRDDTVDVFGLQEYRSTDQRFTRGKPLQFHTGTVNCVRPLQRGGLLATASSDKTVAIVDLEAGELITTFRAHQNSVHSVEYIEHLNLMLSSAFDTEPKVWMLASSAMRSEAFTLRDPENPHTGVVVDACSITDTPQVCTLDSHGTVKLWDIRMFRAQQSIRLEKTMEGIFDPKSLKWNSVVWDPVAQELVAFAQRRAQKLRRKVLLKEDTVKGSPTKAAAGSPNASEKKKQAPAAVASSCSMADDSPIIDLVFEPVSQTIVSLAEKKVRVWDIFTGHQEAIFDSVVPYDTVASSLCVSSTGKIFFLGLRSGRLTSHQFSSGTLLQTFVDEGPEVTSLTYCAFMQAFCATTWRGARIFMDHPNDNSSFFPDSGKGAEVKSTSFDPLMSLLCTVERRGNVSLWESRSGRFTSTSAKCAGSLSVGAHADVTTALILTGFPVMAIATQAGSVQLFTTSPHPVPNRKFAECLFKGREVTQMQFYPPKNVLYCGDDQGWLHAFDCTGAFESVSCAHASGSWEAMMTTVGRLGSAPRDIYIMRTAHHVHAHTEPVGSLVWAANTDILISSAADQRILFWQLNLAFIGELDPLSETGRFVLPITTPPATRFEYVTKAAPGEHITFTSATLAGATELSSGLKPSESLTIDPQDDGQNLHNKLGSFSATKFAEGIHRVAVALESFVPNAKKEKDLVGALAAIGVDESDMSKAFGKRAVVVSPVRTQSSPQTKSAAARNAQWSLINSLRVGVPEADVPREFIYSANSSGVACRSLFSPLPDPAGQSPKKVVVDAVTPDTTAQRGGVPMTVTRNFPLPTNARRDRDWLIRELQLREEHEAMVASRKAAEEADKMSLVPSAINPQTRLSASALSAEHTSRSVGSGLFSSPIPANRPQTTDSLVSASTSVDRGIGQAQDGPGKAARSGRRSQSRNAVHSEDRVATSADPLLSESFFGQSASFEALPLCEPDREETHQQVSRPTAHTEGLPRLYKQMLPCDLLRMRKELSVAKREQRRGAARASSTPVGQQAPRSWVVDDDIDWQAPHMSKAVSHQPASLNGTATLSQTALTAAVRHLTSASDVLESTHTLALPPTVGFSTFGVRSLTPNLMRRCDMKHGTWSKSHRVPMDCAPLSQSVEFPKRPGTDNQNTEALSTRPAAVPALRSLAHRSALGPSRPPLGTSSVMKPPPAPQLGSLIHMQTA